MYKVSVRDDDGEVVIERPFYEQPTQKDFDELLDEAGGGFIDVCRVDADPEMGGATDELMFEQTLEFECVPALAGEFDGFE